MSCDSTLHNSQMRQVHHISKVEMIGNDVCERIWNITKEHQSRIQGIRRIPRAEEQYILDTPKDIS